tara:strand:- start:413 stop:679 length:267 start_codon:yes stop_codon:yes gene_type:complete
MNIFGVGLPEIAVIGALALIIFGPKKLPELGRTLGKTLKSLQSASSEFEREIQKAIDEPEESQTDQNKDLTSTDTSEKDSPDVEKDIN